MEERIPIGKLKLDGTSEDILVYAPREPQEGMFEPRRDEGFPANLCYSNAAASGRLGYTPGNIFLQCSSRPQPPADIIETYQNPFMSSVGNLSEMTCEYMPWLQTSSDYIPVLAPVYNSSPYSTCLESNQSWGYASAESETSSEPCGPAKTSSREEPVITYASSEPSTTAATARSANRSTNRLLHHSHSAKDRKSPPFGRSEESTLLVSKTKAKRRKDQAKTTDPDLCSLPGLPHLQISKQKAMELESIREKDTAKYYALARVYLKETLESQYMALTSPPLIKMPKKPKSGRNSQKSRSGVFCTESCCSRKCPSRSLNRASCSSDRGASRACGTSMINCGYTADGKTRPEPEHIDGHPGKVAREPPGGCKCEAESRSHRTLNVCSTQRNDNQSGPVLLRKPIDRNRHQTGSTEKSPVDGPKSAAFKTFSDFRRETTKPARTVQLCRAKISYDAEEETEELVCEPQMKATCRQSYVSTSSNVARINRSKSGDVAQAATPQDNDPGDDAILPILYNLMHESHKDKVALHHFIAYSTMSKCNLVKACRSRVRPDGCKSRFARVPNVLHRITVLKLQHLQSKVRLATYREQLVNGTFEDDDDNDGDNEDDDDSDED